MTRENVLALLSGILFGTGLAISGMIDPARVRAFLDVTGNWAVSYTHLTLPTKRIV